MRIASRITYFASLSLLLFALPTAAQETEADPSSQSAQPTFFETVEVKIVNVDVVVTDKDGNPVLGLGREDFEILEDGKPVEITNFFAMEGGRQTEEIAPDEAPTEDFTVEIPEDQRRYLMIFVDNFNLTPGSRNRILDEVKTFVEGQAGAADRFMVASYDGSLEVQLPPTEEVERVLGAIDQAMRETARGVQNQLAMRQILNEIQGAGELGGGTGSLGSSGGGGFGLDSTSAQARASFGGIRLYTQERYNEARDTVRHVKTFVDSLTALPGRKALLYVSEGISTSPGQALLQAWENAFPNETSVVSGAAEILNFDTGTLVAEMAEYASTNRVTFYAIGAGEASISSTDADMGLGSTNLNTRGGGRPWNQGLESLEAINHRASLEMMAATTGGLAAVNLSAVDDTLSRMRQDLENYYSLAYTPSRPRDGKAHSIRVRVKHEGLIARHRESYRAKTVEREMEDRTMSALLLGNESNPLGVEVEFGRESETEKSRYLVPVMVKIPMGRIVLLPREEFHEGRLTIFLSARDERGRSSPIQKTEVPLRIPNDQIISALSQVGGYGLNVEMRSGRHRVAVTVRDELGNAQSSVASEFTPGRLRVDTSRRSAPGSR